MKKIILALSAIILTVAPASAGQNRHIRFDQLPGVSQQFVREHFADAQISIVMMDKELFDTSYEVIFSDGRKVEFGKDGQWKEIDCKFGRVPESALPAPIAGFVSDNHPGLFVVEIDRDKRDYEMKMNNGAGLKFDLKFNFLGYDD